MKADGMLTQSLGRLFAVSESYPDLKANQNMMSLQEELASTENRIGFSRQHYNDAVMKMNNGIEQFPANMVAGMFNFKLGDSFEVENDEERKVVKVSF
jgi:LemA protein